MATRPSCRRSSTAPPSRRAMPHEFAAMASQPRHARYYTRYGNPLHEQLAAQLVALEGGAVDGHDALLTASGMGAISLVLLGLLKAGDHVVAQTNHYMGSAKHFSELLPRFGVRCTLVDQTDLAQWERAIAAGHAAGDDRDAGQSDLRADRSRGRGAAGARAGRAERLRQHLRQPDEPAAAGAGHRRRGAQRHQVPGRPPRPHRRRGDRRRAH